MGFQLALSRLDRDDLSLFGYQGDGRHQGGITFPASVLVKELFPRLPRIASAKDARFPIDLHVIGPGDAPAINLQRRIVPAAFGQNWRLFGELVRDDDEQRFRPLQEGDLAVIEFEGDAAPYAARLVLVAKEMSADAAAHGELDAWLGNRRMAQITPGQLDTIVAAAKVAEAHPLNGINLQNELEDAAQGGLEAARRLFKRSTTRKVSKTELKAARNQADETGAVGEEFVNEWLTDERASGRIDGFEWISRDNAIAPYDFTTTPPAGQLERLDVKATSGPFRNALHMSVNELLHCADSSVPYRIYRVFAVDGRKAKMRISDPLATFATGILPILEKLPAGVSVDGISIDPTRLSFGPGIDLELNPDGDE